MAWSNMFSSFSFPNFYRIFQGRVRSAEMGTHTIKSHGTKVARDHMLDWLILLLLVLIDVILYVSHPFYRFVGRDMMTDLKYPVKENTVPVWSVPMYTVFLPIAVFLLFYTRRKDVYDLHHSILGLLFSVLITAVITDAIKNAVGRPRPDFFWRCFPDGNELYNRWGNAVCHGRESDIREGHKSFPSGHTSWSFAGLGFLSIYLSGKIKAFDQKGHVAKLCIVFFPLLMASLVGISRVDDYGHHWQDVFAGGLLGLVVATFCYAQLFPPPYNDEGNSIFTLHLVACGVRHLDMLEVRSQAVLGWGPYEYFRALEESRSNTNSGESVNELDVQPMSLAVVSQQVRKHGNEFAALEDLESGRR